MMKPALKSGCLMALSITLNIGPCFAIVPVNTINTNTVIPGGNYFNTPSNVTAFRNTSGSGLWLKSGTAIRALEVVDSNGKLTNNGGTIQLFAPGSVVRVDGTIDVRGVQNPLGGAYLGNGGNVFINAAYLYQNGHIMASGINGGLIQADVGSITMTPGSTITANGAGGQGGIISIHASGPVDLQRGSLIDTSGKVRAAFDTNVINIEGSLINAESTLRANGIQDRGGTIRLVSTGQSDLTQTQIGLQQAVKAGTLSQSMASGIHGRQASLVAQSDGDTRIAGKTPEHAAALVSAQGTGLSISPNNDPVDTASRSGDGGTIIITAQRNIVNAGNVMADGASGIIYGGNGGTVSLNAGSAIVNNGSISANGGSAKYGGSGGLIAASYTTALPNAGTIRAQGANGILGTGGNGGLIDLVSMVNPSLKGLITASAGRGSLGFSSGLLGSVVTADPGYSSNTLIGTLRRVQPIEAITNAENYIMLMRSDAPADINTVYALLNHAQIRSIQNQVGFAPNTIADAAQFDNKLHLGVRYPSDATDYINNPAYLFRNIILSNATKYPFEFNPSVLDTRGLARDPGAANYLLVSNGSDPFNTMTLLSAGGLSFVGGGIPTTSAHGPITNWGFGFGGGHFSSISDNFSASNLIVGNVDFNLIRSAGSINIAASNSVDSTSDFGPVSLGNNPFGNIESQTTLYGGSLIVKSPSITTNPFLGYRANGNLLGGTAQVIAKNITLLPYETADFPSGISADGGRFGGSIYLQALRIQNFATLSATGEYGGYIGLVGHLDPTGAINASGTIQNDKIVKMP